MRLFLISLFFSLSLFANELGWDNDYKKALADAKVENKDVYVLITSSDCRWCRKFESTTLQDKEILKYLDSRYILVHLNRDFDEMPEYFQAKRVPTHYFVTKDEEVIHTFPGFWSSEDFKVFLGDIDKKKLK
ncbi:MAG: thioredoxin family protein [Campylobacterales bacterium]|nr:thioredoxin family protein [Campylobacterales bacterium]